MNVKSEFLVDVNVNTEGFVTFVITVSTYQNAQCYSSRHRRLTTLYLVPYHCGALTVSMAGCKAVPEKTELSSRPLRVKAIDFGGRDIELPRQIHLIFLCLTMILITMQFSASGKRKVNTNILWCMCNVREQVYCRFFHKTCAKTKPSDQKSYRTFLLHVCILLLLLFILWVSNLLLN
jgi:hypothetical protein